MRATSIRAEMADGSVITETAADFGAFVDLVLGFRRDPDAVRVTWADETPAPLRRPGAPVVVARAEALACR